MANDGIASENEPDERGVAEVEPRAAIAKKREAEDKADAIAKRLRRWTRRGADLQALAEDPRWGLSWTSDALAEEAAKATTENKWLKYAPIWLRELVAIALATWGALKLTESFLPDAPNRSWVLGTLSLAVALLVVPLQRRAALQKVLAMTCPAQAERMTRLQGAARYAGAWWLWLFRLGWVLIPGSAGVYTYWAVPRSYVFLAADQVKVGPLFDNGLLRQNNIAVVDLQCDFDLVVDTSKLSPVGFACDELHGGAHAADARLTIDVTDLTGPCSTAPPNWAVQRKQGACILRQTTAQKMGEDAPVHLQADAGPELENCLRRIMDARIQLQITLATRCLPGAGILAGGRDLKMVRQ